MRPRKRLPQPKRSEVAFHGTLLHRPAHLRVGHRNRHHAGRRAVDPRTAGVPVSVHRAAGDRRQRPLSGRIGQGGRGFGHPGHRTEDDRAGRPAVHELELGFVRPGLGHADLLRRYRPRHRPGAGAEQDADRTAPAAATGAAAGRHGRQVGAQLPDGDRLRVRGRQPVRYRLVGLPRRLGAGSAVAGRWRRRSDGVRFAVLDAGLARSCPPDQLQAHLGRRARSHRRAERRSVGRPARRYAGGAGPGLHRDHHRAEPAADRRAVREHPAAQQHAGR